MNTTIKVSKELYNTLKPMKGGITKDFDTVIKFLTEYYFKKLAKNVSKKYDIQEFSFLGWDKRQGILFIHKACLHSIPGNFLETHIQECEGAK